MCQKHQAATTKRLPFGGPILSQCACGARQRSDGVAIGGAVLDVDGWYVQQRDDHAAYRALQNEGHEDGPEARDMRDEFDSGRGE